jgi:hypothetical protein
MKRRGPRHDTLAYTDRTLTQARLTKDYFTGDVKGILGVILLAVSGHGHRRAARVARGLAGDCAPANRRRGGACPARLARPVDAIRRLD